MKKILYLLSVALIATGCATGYYAPRNVNQYGMQTQVVLSQANYRIVRHLEVVIDVNNTNLKRADVEKSAYAELLRRANLTGSQALINVVIEEVRREKHYLWGFFKVTQHVAARATIIEFLDNSGNPIPSVDQQGSAPRVEVENKTVSTPNSVAPQGSAPRAQSSEPVEKKTPVVNVVSPIEAEDIIDDAQKMANDCYIAYLMKTNDFWQSANRQTLNQLCDINHIMKLGGKYKVEVLKQCSTGYDKKLHSYSKSLMTK